jgi:hypothetical protein
VLTKPHDNDQQEEERERRMDFIPDVSAVNVDLIEVRFQDLGMLLN